MEKQVFRTIISLLLAAVLICSSLSGMPFSAAYAEGQEINVAGLSLMTNTPYTVLLEPAEKSSSDFSPVVVTLEFQTADYCVLTWNGEQVGLGVYPNRKYVDLFSLESDVSMSLIFGGEWDPDCAVADYALRVSSYTQAQNALPVFGSPTRDTDAPVIVEIPEKPVLFRAGNLDVVEDAHYSMLVIPDESCDQIFDPFTMTVSFFNDSGFFIVTEQYKNVSSVYPGTYYRNDIGWLELSSVSGKFWGMMDSENPDVDLTFHVTGLEKNMLGYFNITAIREDTPGQEPGPAPEPPAEEPDPEMYYYYSLLGEGEKADYRQMLRAINDCAETVELPYPVSNNEVNHIYWNILFDQPQIFWADQGYLAVRYSSGKVAEIRLLYNDLAQDLPEEQAKVETTVSRILAGTAGMTDPEKERYVHDLLIPEIRKYTYSRYNQNIYSSLVIGETVCAGYSRAFQYLMQRCGIPCYYCIGLTPSNPDDPFEGRHAWNVIRLNGEWYNVDVTWDDNWEGGDFEYISYEYYNVTDQNLSREHTRRDDGELIPACNASGASFDALYGRDWVEEVAAANGASVITGTDDFLRICYNQLMKTGVGQSTCRIIIKTNDLYQYLFGNKFKDDYKTACFNPFLRDSGLKGSVSYSWSFTRNWKISGREPYYYIEMKQEISQ